MAALKPPVYKDDLSTPPLGFRLISVFIYGVRLTDMARLILSGMLALLSAASFS